MARTVVVTGCASGLGAATRRRLEEQGDRVIGVDLRDAEVLADLSTPAGRDLAVAKATEAGQGRLDGVIGFAGVGPTAEPPSLLSSVNYFGQMAVLDGLRPALRAGRNSAAVAVGSVAATVSPYDRAAVEAMLAGDEPLATRLVQGAIPLAYATSKMAVARAARRRSVDWIREGIRLNILAPGNSLTPLTQAALDDPVIGPLMRQLPVPFGRWAENDEIADVAVWLLGEDSRYLVGSWVAVDGGTDALARPECF
jgi:NAD(P)-dependent dehydrogenase (short-subunit alcohol dehydrogenase family)